MTQTVILACRDARSPQWQLGRLPPAAGRLTLIGWSHAAERHDAGVPAEVAGVLARALTSAARVTFPCSAVKAAATGSWSLVDGDLIRVQTGKGAGARLVARLTGTPAGVTLISTRRPETAMRLFDDASFPWWLQGQVVFLSGTDAPAPEVGEDALIALSGDDWSEQAAPLGQAGIEGIVRPGVDGDVAGLLTLTDTFDRSVIAALERETRGAGFEWAEVAEEAFAERAS